MMLGTWASLKNRIKPPRRWRYRYVLEEFNGPIIVLQRGHARRGPRVRWYLAVAADEDGPIDRWIRVERSAEDRDAFVDLHKLFRTHVVEVIDVVRATGECVAAWAVPGGEIEEDNIPTPGAGEVDLPLEARRVFREGLGGPT